MEILETFTLQLNPWYYTGRKKRRLKRRIVGMVLVSLCLFQSPLAQDEESQCETYESEKCIHEVRLKIGKKSAEIRKSYTLSMFTPQGNEGTDAAISDNSSTTLPQELLLIQLLPPLTTNISTERKRPVSLPFITTSSTSTISNFTCFTTTKQTVALFDYVGLDFYTCDPASGYVCNKESETVFSVTTPCAPGTKFSFFAEGEKALPCMSIQREKSMSELESDSNEPTDFQNDDSRTSHQIKNAIIVAVCTGVIISGTAATLYLLLKRGILSTYFKKKRDKNVIRDDVTEETPSISEDKIYDTEIDYENEQYTAQDDKTVT